MFWLSPSTTYDGPGKHVYTPTQTHHTSQREKTCECSAATFIHVCNYDCLNCVTFFFFFQITHIWVGTLEFVYSASLFLSFFLSSRFKIKGDQAGCEVTSLFRHVPIGTGILTLSIYSIHWITEVIRDHTASPVPFNQSAPVLKSAGVFYIHVNPHRCSLWIQRGRLRNAELTQAGLVGGTVE